MSATLPPVLDRLSFLVFQSSFAVNAQLASGGWLACRS